MTEEKKGEEFEIDFGVGKLKFGGLFKGIGNLIDLASKLGEEASEIKKVGEIKGIPKGAKGVYGFSIRTMAGDKPIIETFGNIKDTPKGPVVDEVREPIADVFDEKDYILVIMELPGVQEEDIKVEVEGDILKLSATGRSSKYGKEVLLPAPVKPETMKTAYNNGVLEITISRD